FDQRVAQPRVAVHHFHQVVYDAIFQPHDDIQVAQADVGVHQTDAAAQLGQTYAEVGRGRRLAHAAFSTGDHDDFARHGHRTSYTLAVRFRFTERTARF